MDKTQKVKEMQKPKITATYQVEMSCDSCAERAIKKHTYLLGDDPRREKRSNAFGKDSCVWCSDREAASCGKLECVAHLNQHMKKLGYSQNTTFDRIKPYEHMFWGTETVETALFEAMEELESILCDPEGKACFRGSGGDLEIANGAFKELKNLRDRMHE